MVKGLIFDLDGTVLDTIGDIADACNETMKKFGFPQHTEEEYLAMIGRGLKQLLRDSMPEGTSDEVHSEGYDFLVEHYGRNNMNRTCPYKGIPEVLKFAKDNGLVMAVLSNKAQQLTDPMVKYFFGNIFDYVVGKRDGVPRKPDPASAIMLQKDMGLDKDELLYIGDTDIDMKTAKAAGFTSIGVTWGFRSEEVVAQSGADYIVHNPDELKMIIEKHLKGAE